jgi:hypothetical protein
MKWVNRLLVITIITVCLILPTTSCAGGKQVSIALSLSAKQVTPGEQFKVQVQVEPQKQGVSAGEINLSFDSQAMQVVEVKPGTLLGERPLAGILNIDNEAGTLGYSLARIGETTAPTSGAAFAIVTFQILNSAQPGDYELELTKVGLANENFGDIGDFTIQGASVKISH